MTSTRILASFLVVVAVSGGWSEVEGQARTRAKVIGRYKVTGSGISIPASSARHCLALCNKHPACDAANFHVDKYKCQIFTRCSPRFVMAVNSSLHFYFAKRPEVNDRGFKYHKESDSCLKLIEEAADYAGADLKCRKQGGRLVSLHEPNINEEAASLLRESNAQFAWIGLTDSRTEGNPLHSNGRRVSETGGFFPIASQGHRNDTRRNCWSVSDTGEWSEHSCKDRKQYSICQIVSF